MSRGGNDLFDPIPVEVVERDIVGHTKLLDVPAAPQDEYPSALGETGQVAAMACKIMQPPRRIETQITPRIDDYSCSRSMMYE